MTTPPLLDDWADRPLDWVLAEARQLVEDPDYPTVRRWRENGGRVIGHFQVYFAEELAHAAGCLPVKVRGGALDPRQAEARFGSYLCSIVKTSLELALGGALPLDLIVVPAICDAARNLAAVWGRNVSYPSRILYFPQNAASPHAIEYLAGEYARVLQAIEQVAGQRVSGEQLARSIAVFNENRALIRGLYHLRREHPSQLRLDELYVLTLIGTLVPREEHNLLLRSALKQLQARPEARRDQLRVVFVGGFCEQPPLDLLRVVADCCHVVDDDLLIGLRWMSSDVRASDAPLTALARGYLESAAVSPVQHDPRRPKVRALLDMIRAARAQAAILAAAKMCEPGLDEQVAWSRALDAAGVPYFVSEFEERMSNFEHLQIQLETFAENVLFA